jgi:O-antigen/teichoic acid export membrane protein
VLLIGGVFLSFQYMPYHLAIANGHTKTNVRLGIVAIICIIPTLIFFVKQYGLIGATYTWLIMNIFAYFYLGYFIISKFMKNEFKRWLINGTLIPLLISLLMGFVGYVLTFNLQKGYYVILYSVIIGVITLSLNFFVFNKMNTDYKINLKQVVNND